MDGAEDSVRLAERKYLNFPLLSDPDMSVIRAYGVAMKGQDIAVPAVFIVSKAGDIRYRRVGESLNDRPTVDVLVIEVDKVRSIDDLGPSPE